MKYKKRIKKAIKLNKKCLELVNKDWYGGDKSPENRSLIKGYIHVLQELTSLLKEN